MRRRTAAAIVMGLVALAAAADARECNITIAEEAVVATVGATATLELADGRRVRLAALDMPRKEEARAALAMLAAGKSVALGLAERGTDRHGDLLAQVFVSDTWLQARLVNDGLARVASRTDTSRCAAPLLKHEREARTAKRGLWADPAYHVRKPEELATDIGTFQIVEGAIVSVKAARERTYLNFGADYRTDFTVTISARDRKRLAKEGIDPAAWSGKTVRVRGWLSLLNGPEIELTHAEQIEILN